MASIDAYNHLDNSTALEHFRGRLRGGVRADVLLPSKSYAVQPTLLEYRLLSSVAEFETLEVEGDHREVDDDVARHAADDVGRPSTTALRTTACEKYLPKCPLPIGLALGLALVFGLWHFP